MHTYFTREQFTQICPTKIRAEFYVPISPPVPFVYTLLQNLQMLLVCHSPPHYQSCADYSPGNGHKLTRYTAASATPLYPVQRFREIVVVTFQATHHDDHES